MVCPYCNIKMEKGKINQDRYALKWRPQDGNSQSKKIKLTSFMEKPYVYAYLCRGCNKIIINIE